MYIVQRAVLEMNCERGGGLDVRIKYGTLCTDGGGGGGGAGWAGPNKKTFKLKKIF
jgi:hypothetical protein